ncbi:hypothetical protein Mapa_016668 [Marchantia paleacea]|nr:hypothetical protein Mapa_016668 [Marchantia paleacea]
MQFRPEDGRISHQAEELQILSLFICNSSKNYQEPLYHVQKRARYTLSLDSSLICTMNRLGGLNSV